MTLSLDRVLPSTTPDSWDLAEVFAYGIGYGLYLSASTLALFAVMHNTSFFENRFGVDAIAKDVNDRGGHMVIYLQVAIISQALIFVTRSHGPSWTERPSVALMLAFCLAQLISSIIAAFGNWGFTDVRAISGGWIGIVWVWK
jgi:H+-transporting ATPase